MSAPDTLRAKWAVGIDEDNPQYAFIGVEGASICWVENDDADAFRKIVDAHNATLDAWEADLQAKATILDVAKAIHLARCALRQRLVAAERRCDPCGFTLAECMDARRAGKLACCPECNHPALAAHVPGTPAGESGP